MVRISTTMSECSSWPGPSGSPLFLSENRLENRRGKRVNKSIILWQPPLPVLAAMFEMTLQLPPHLPQLPHTPRHQPSPHLAWVLSLLFSRPKKKNKKNRQRTWRVVKVISVRPINSARDIGLLDKEMLYVQHSTSNILIHFLSDTCYTDEISLW